MKTEFEEEDNNIFYCRKCNASVEKTGYSGHPIIWSKGFYYGIQKYCPNCGEKVEKYEQKR